MRIDSKTKLLGLLGDPVEHSLSAAMHNFLLRRLKLDFCYLAFQVGAEALKPALEGVRALGIAGVNVTVPHKQAVIPFLDELKGEALVLGAVNTIKNTDGKLIGYNTDGSGFRQSLAAHGIKLKGKRAVVLGAGGAARAVVYSLMKLGIGSVAIYNRTHSRAQKLVNELRRKTRFRDVHAKRFSPSQLYRDIVGSHLLVNATSVGMQPFISMPLEDPSYLHSDLIVYDLIYNPLKTPLLVEAERRGAFILSGLDMFIYQGLEALRLWTGRKITPSLLAEVRDHLKLCL